MENANRWSALSGCLPERTGSFLRIGVTLEQLEWKKFHPSSPSVPNTVIPGLAEEKTEKLSLNEAIERAKRILATQQGLIAQP